MNDPSTHHQVGARHLLGVKAVPLDDELTLASTLARLIIIIIIIIIIINIIMIMMVI